MNTSITATLEVTDEGSSMGEQYQSAYEIRLYADGRQIGRVGDVVAAVEGWALGAWLAPGAHQDIDGSGLANWGGSQPGGWTTADGDGCYSGLPRVDDLRFGWPCARPGAADPILIRGGEGCPSLEVAPSEIPEWAEAVERMTAAAGADPADEVVAGAWDAAWDAALDAAAAIRAEIAEALSDAIASVADEGHPQEPAAEDVLAQLRGEEQDGLEWGDYQGAGPVIAWRDSAGEAQICWWPTEAEVREALGDTVLPAMVRRILGDLSPED